jgi:putative acetyltransferase
VTDAESIEIVGYEDRFADDFARLNREWLERFDLYEPADAKQLYSPRETILDPGGEILVAVASGRVVGTCAIVRVGPGVVELAKLSVAAEARERGLGRRLTRLALDRARAMGATRVELVSNHQLTSAIRLYESLGFRHLPLPPDLHYATADVYMELALDSPEP